MNIAAMKLIQCGMAEKTENKIFCGFFGFVFSHSQAKVLKNGLKSRDFGHRGVHHGGWWPPFFVFLMPLKRWRLERNYNITQKSAVSVIVSEFCVIV